MEIEFKQNNEIEYCPEKAETVNGRDKRRQRRKIQLKSKGKRKYGY